MSDARTQILGRIRSQLDRAKTADEADRLRDYAAISREYCHTGSLDAQERTTRFRKRLVDYDAEVLEVEEQTIASSIAEVLARHQQSVLFVPPALPQAWLPPDIEILRDGQDGEPALSLEMLTRKGAVLTGCAVAVAETGTILLVHGSGYGRRVLTLLPDHCICVVGVQQIVETVPEALERIDALKTQPVTMISGPSATADIEMTRIRGVHGPRRLTVILVD